MKFSSSITVCLAVYAKVVASQTIVLNANTFDSGLIAFIAANTSIPTGQVSAILTSNGVLDEVNTAFAGNASVNARLSLTPVACNSTCSTTCSTCQVQASQLENNCIASAGIAVIGCLGASLALTPEACLLALGVAAAECARECANFCAGQLQPADCVDDCAWIPACA